MVCCNKAEVIEVIRTVTTVGDGSKENPIRRQTQIWSLDGELLYTLDTFDEDVTQTVVHGNQ